MSTTDPQVMIRYSDDGGETWSAQMFFPLGTPADSYTRRVKLFQQGTGFQRIYEVEYAEADERGFTLVECIADVSLGTD